jgi:hypothetical protein
MSRIDVPILERLFIRRQEKFLTLADFSGAAHSKAGGLAGLYYLAS